MPAQDYKEVHDFPEVDEFRTTKREGETSHLHFRVGKASNGGAVELSAQVMGHHEGFTTFVIFADYLATVTRVPSKRVTQAAINKLADTITDRMVEDVKLRAIAYYKQKAIEKEQRGY